MGYFQMPHFDWLEDQGLKCSPFGREVAYIIGCTFYGIYNAPIDHDHIDWPNERAIKVAIDRGLATFDSSHLTLLALFAHEMCIRISIQPVVKFSQWDDENDQSILIDTVTADDDVPKNAEYCRPGLDIWFHKRSAREGGIDSRHPTMEQALASFKSAYTHPDLIAQELAKGEV